MNQRRFKKVCSFLLAGAMIWNVFPYTGNAVYAQQETEQIQPAETATTITPNIMIP